MKFLAVHHSLPRAWFAGFTDTGDVSRRHRGALYTSWTILEPDYEELIADDTLAFLDHFVMGKPVSDVLLKRVAGVSDLRVDF